MSKLKGTALAKAVLAAATVILLVYEGWSLANDQEGDTLSEGVWAITESFPVFLFIAGFLCGHWFWPRRSVPRGSGMRSDLVDPITLRLGTAVRPAFDRLRIGDVASFQIRRDDVSSVPVVRHAGGTVPLPASMSGPGDRGAEIRTDRPAYGTITTQADVGGETPGRDGASGKVQA